MRNNHVVVNDNEQERLEQVRKDVFISSSIPMGEVIDYLLEEAGYHSEDYEVEEEEEDEDENEGEE